MSHIFDWIFSQYHGVPAYIVVLELVAVTFGVFSVIYSKKNNVLVYPTGIISTFIFVYILYVYGLLGDMIINAYYFSMSIYGWYIWTRKVDETHYTPITKTNKKEQQYIPILFVGTLLFITLVYLLFGNLEKDFFHKSNFASYVDVITTGFFFVGMWLLAKRKLENWTYLIIGNIISIPLYIYKGLIFSALLYVTLTIIAFYGYYVWKKILHSNPLQGL